MCVCVCVCVCVSNECVCVLQVLLTLNTLALNMVSVVHNALKTFESIQKQLMGPDYVRTQVHTHTHTH